MKAALRRIGLTVVAFSLSACSNTLDRQRAADVYVRKGVGYMEEGRYDVALEDLKHAIELQRDNSEAHNALGVLFERINRLDEAREHYQRSVDLNTQNFAALNNFSRFLCSHGDVEAGIANLQRVLDSKLYNQPWLALTNQGMCYKTAGQLDLAEQSWRAALDSNATFAPALLELARLNIETQQFLKARAFLQRYAAIENYNAEVLSLALNAELGLGNSGGARAALEQLKTRFPDAPETARAKALFDAP